MRRVLLESRNFNVCEDEFVYDDLGDVRTIQYVEQPKVAIAVVVLGDGKVLMASHWRPLLGQTLLECPGGKVDHPGEDIEEGLCRELGEEVGYSPQHIRLLGSFFTSVGSSTEEIFAFEASKLVKVRKRISDTHRMRIEEVSVSELRAMLKERSIKDGKTIIALSMYLDELSLSFGR